MFCKKLLAASLGQKGKIREEKVCFSIIYTCALPTIISLYSLIDHLFYWFSQSPWFSSPIHYILPLFFFYNEEGRGIFFRNFGIDLPYCTDYIRKDCNIRSTCRVNFNSQLPFRRVVKIRNKEYSKWYGRINKAKVKGTNVAEIKGWRSGIVPCSLTKFSGSLGE